MKIQSENIAFDAGDLLDCNKCGRQNPPNRGNCLYCTAALEIPDTIAGQVKLNLRPLENWENGFNVVLIPPAELPNIDAVGKYLKYGPEQVGRMLEAHAPFPLARLGSETDAEAAVKVLAELGLNCRVISDVDLKVGRPNKRLRSTGFNDGRLFLTDFNTGELQKFESAEIILIVTGRIVDSKTEAVEKRKKSERKVVSESATNTDDLIIDIYTAHNDTGFRISTRGFDFSGLGSEKRLLSVENIALLLAKLRVFARAAKVVDDYNGIMSALSSVWDIDRRTDFEGLKRLDIWNSGYSSVVRTTNLEQFTKYSRLQRLLL